MLPGIFAQLQFLQYLLGPVLFILSLFLILLVLVQRGRGGGLTGALGGMGGQSAFGSKAGDVFTKVTVVVASVWIVLCLLIIGTQTRLGFAPTGGARNAAVSTDDTLDVPEADKGTSDAGTGGSGTTSGAGAGGSSKSGSTGSTKGGSSKSKSGTTPDD